MSFSYFSLLLFIFIARESSDNERNFDLDPSNRNGESIKSIVEILLQEICIILFNCCDINYVLLIERRSTEVLDTIMIEFFYCLLLMRLLNKH